MPETCLNPHFFAYGQLPLYLSYGGVQIYNFLTGYSGQPTYNEATLALRIVSALASIAVVGVLLKILELTIGKKMAGFKLQILSVLLFIFQPYAVQLAHFGTTESMLMLFYALIIYFSLRLITQFTARDLFFAAFFSGLALGTKTSSLLFLGVPITSIFFMGFFPSTAGGAGGGAPRHARTSPELARSTDGVESRGRIYRTVIYIFAFLLLSFIFFILSSPHSLLNWTDFVSSMNYESAVGLGTYKAFYTRQFEGTIPLLFQFQNILPYVLGWPTLLMGIVGFFIVPWRKRHQVVHPYTILRVALLITLLPPSFFYAKWTRFIAPAFPLFTLFALLFLFEMIKGKRTILGYFILFCALIPGFAYLSVYTSPDIRFTASAWIYDHIPSGSTILSETANVVDLPIPSPLASSANLYSVNSFNFYDLDTTPQLQTDLTEALKTADYIIVPSRRIFKNHDAAQYPLLAQYYADLFSGKAGFTLVAELSSYPRIKWFGKTLVSFPDENAEETWTVFDHPVVRIYKRGAQSSLDFSQYKKQQMTIGSETYNLLVADSPERWEQGLMYVRSKVDIGGLDGMVFTFPDSAPRLFWNKNTVSNLTLVWMNAGREIGRSQLPSIEESKTITTVSSPGNADTVVELLN
jgi:uncharacterized membrane protein (UPF0127 family)